MSVVNGKLDDETRDDLNKLAEVFAELPIEARVELFGRIAKETVGQMIDLIQDVLGDEAKEKIAAAMEKL